MDANLTILLIFVVVLTAACYAVRRLSSTPAKVAAVIVALAALVGALKPVVSLISDPQQAPGETLAPAAPPVAASPSVVHSSGPDASASSLR
ncbi:hypothetical protein QJ054_32955 [Streptomyces sp. AN-3]|uniref:Uncharacterized protein n=1 Tax=Streptomyces rochei TaxID=1928 RepID=A0ABW7E9R5_STRRO|nr:hypothetical protein [Streptomyces sp. AN-3]MDI3101855.1 hypothetical protein [Streptomyces sp. AN-3]